mmetsp:Transcript_1264/g.1500  ORF Transcript_1264/g.1500 Transcript_1264/m.1500 type:complete len:90 (+) Transcript_1264:520-789(+)
MDQVKETKENVCTICLEPVKHHKKTRELLNCGHLFHEECLRHWLKANTVTPTCPSCKSKLQIHFYPMLSEDSESSNDNNSVESQIRPTH